MEGRLKPVEAPLVESPLHQEHRRPRRRRREEQDERRAGAQGPGPDQAVGRGRAGRAVLQEWRRRRGAEHGEAGQAARAGPQGRLIGC